MSTDLGKQSLQLNLRIYAIFLCFLRLKVFTFIKPVCHLHALIASELWSIINVGNIRSRLWFYSLICYICFDVLAIDDHEILESLKLHFIQYSLWLLLPLKYSSVLLLLVRYCFYCIMSRSIERITVFANVIIPRSLTASLYEAAERRLSRPFPHRVWMPVLGGLNVLNIDRHLPIEVLQRLLSMLFNSVIGQSLGRVLLLILVIFVQRLESDVILILIYWIHV